MDTYGAIGDVRNQLQLTDQVIRKCSERNTESESLKRRKIHWKIVFEMRQKCEY